MKTLTIRLLYVFLLSGVLFSCEKESAIPGEDTETGTSTTSPVTKPKLDVAETQPPVEVAVTADITSNCGGYFKALPARYDATTKKYPLLIFIHGQSALGTGSADDLKKVAGGPHGMLKKKQFPPSFTVGKENFSFIVISPQFKTWPTADDVDAVVKYFSSKLRIDPTRIYVTGLSMGGGVTWDYAGKYASKIAAIVPVCGASSTTNAKAKVMVNNNLPVWAFHNEGDPTVSVNNTLGYIDMLNSMKINPKAKKSIFPEASHDAWTTAYSVTYKENKMNMYEWMLQYHQ